MADLGLIGTLPAGVFVAVVTGATTTGTGHSYEFGLEMSPVTNAHVLSLAVQGASAVPTTVTADLEASYDGAQTWVKYSAATTGMTLVATTVSTAFPAVNVVSGPVYRINATTVTIGSAVSFKVWACQN